MTVKNFTECLKECAESNNSKTVRWWKSQSRLVSYFNHSSKMYMAVQCMFRSVFQHYTNNNKKRDFSFSPTTSQLEYTNWYIKDELEDEDSRNQTTQEK